MWRRTERPARLFRESWQRAARQTNGRGNKRQKPRIEIGTTEKGFSGGEVYAARLTAARWDSWPGFAVGPPFSPPGNRLPPGGGKPFAHSTWDRQTGVRGSSDPGPWAMRTGWFRSAVPLAGRIGPAIGPARSAAQAAHARSRVCLPGPGPHSRPIRADRSTSQLERLMSRRRPTPVRRASPAGHRFSAATYDYPSELE
jgi:hypothetical protein